MKKTTTILLRLIFLKCLSLVLLTISFVELNAQDTTLKGFSPYPFGASISAPLLKNDSQYRSIAAREFNSITPENAMKFAMIHPSQFTYTWADADTIVNFALQHGKRVHGHTLIWNQNVPSWVTYYVGDSAAWENLMKTHIQTIVSHYKGKVTSWDVVNEAILDDGSLRNTIWLQKLGPNYIARAFQYAHEADSSAILFYNDYGHEYPANNFQRLKGIKNVVMSLVNAGVPIHGVGMQLHVSTNSYSYNIKTSIDSMIATGLKIHFSELDVSLNPYYIPTATYNDSMAAELFSKYKFFARIARSIPEDKFYGITTWNVTDRDSWLPKTGNPDWPLPFDSFYQKKTAFQGIYDGATGSWDFDSSSCSSFASTYTDLGSSGTAITTNINGNTMTYDDDNSSVQDIGFGFRYNGSVYQHFVLNTNGYIRFGKSNSGNYFYTTFNGVLGSAITGSHIDLVYPFNRDLKAGSGTPEYRVYTSGSAGSRICTIQFKNVADKQAPTQYANMNFQIKLHESTGVIEFVYGAWTASGNAATAMTAAVGIKGILAGQSVNVAKLSGTAWNSAMTNPSNYDFTNGNYPEPVVGPAFNNRNNALPDAGRTFRFTPVVSPDQESSENMITSAFPAALVDSSDYKLVVFPNPAGCCITVSSDAVLKTRSAIRIYNQAGQLLQTVETFNNRETLNVERYSRGIYYLQWMYKNANGEVQVMRRKIVKQ
jgi:endo-1,4-beta-xylanase